MDASPSPRARFRFKTRTEEQHRRRFALTIRSLTKEWRDDLADCLAKLPPELYSMVLNQLTYTTRSPLYEGLCYDERKDIKVGLSRTSLVCQAWCRIQRPKLFESIRLLKPADVRFLLDMLRRPNNGWLPTAVTEIYIFNYDLHGISMERCCRLLLPKLSSLLVLDYDGDSGRPTRQFGPSLQPVFASHKNIRKLTLDFVLFQSLSVLVHVLGNMVNLEELEVSNWPKHISSSDRAPTRMFLSSFPKLRRVCHETEGDRSGKLGWFLSPLLARRCKDHPEDAASGNSDAVLLVLLGDLLGDSDDGYKSTAVTNVEGTDTILLYNWTGSAITAGKLTLWPSTSISNGKWSAIRTIECFTASDKEGDIIHYPNNRNLDEINWETIDKSLTQDAIRLEKLVVHSNNAAHQQRLPPRLPKLYALGKFKVEETDSDYNELVREYVYSG